MGRSRRAVRQLDLDRAKGGDRPCPIAIPKTGAVGTAGATGSSARSGSPPGAARSADAGPPSPSGACVPIAERNAARPIAHATRRAKVEGRLQGGADAETRRRNARAQAKRRYRERRDAGACTKCGRRPPAEGRSRCEPCLSRRNASERRTWAERLAQGRCGACGARAPDGTARCPSCAALQQRRPSRAAYGRKRYSRRRAQGRCTDCGAHSAGASRCPECARRSYARSPGHRGLPAAPSSFRVVIVETGEDLGCWHTAAELRACLAFSRLSPEDVEVFSDVPVMSGIASWT